MLNNPFRENFTGPKREQFQKQASQLSIRTYLDDLSWDGELVLSLRGSYLGGFFYFRHGEKVRNSVVSKDDFFFMLPVTKVVYYRIGIIFDDRGSRLQVGK